MLNLLNHFLSVFDRLWVRLFGLSSHLTVSRGGQANLDHLHGEKEIGDPRHNLLNTLQIQR